MKKIVKGNDFTLKIPVMKMVEGQPQAFPLPACTDVVVQVCNQFRRIPLAFTIDVKEDNVLLARVEGDRMGIGTYAIEVKGKIFGNDWRSNEYPQFAIVSKNADADTEFVETDDGDNSVEMDTAMVILPPTVELSDLIDKTNEALKNNKETNDTINENEEARKKEEEARVIAEQNRTGAEQSRVEAEEARVTAEDERTNAETSRVNAESDRVRAEDTRAEIEVTRQSNELTRKDNEVKRVAAESERVKSEEARVADESSRVDAEAQRVSAENEREFAENGRASAEAERVQAEKKRQTESVKAVKAANDAAAQANATNESIKTNEQGRVDAETNRKSAEKSRNDKEGIRQESENERISQETERQTNEQKRVEAENKRIKAEEQRNEILAQAKSDCETAAQAASSAAEDATAAKNKAESAATGAERVNIIMQGSTISVTNRDGEVKSVDVINTDEEVTVTIASSVNSINVAGIKINVFLNNGKTPQSYTTNADGKATFTIDRGNYYQVVFPEYGNAQPIAPVGYTAVLGSRNINVEYLPYDEDSMEKVIITATKYVENVGSAWEGIPVIVTVDRKDTTYQTDAKGQVTVFVPYKKEYTVVINDQDGYNVSFNKNSRTYTANVPQRLIDYRFYQFKAGIFVVDIDKNEYYIEDWVAAGRNADDAVAIKVADASLSINHGTFCIRTSDIKNVSKLISTSWCTKNLQFNSIALNGNNVNDANYHNGESSSYLIRQEAQERSLSVPAFDYAYGQIFTIGGEDLHGFVMSVGQEYVHVANIGIIRQVLETLYGEEVATNYYNFVMKKNRWTSTQGNATGAWFCSSSAYASGGKSSSFVVLPVYDC